MSFFVFFFYRLALSDSCSFGESSVEVLSDLVDELEGVEVHGALWRVGVVDDDGQVLGHVTSLDSLDDDTLEGLAPVLELSIVVELGTVEQTTGPGVHGGDRVGGGLSALLVDTVMAGHGTVGSLGLDGTIRGLEHGGHETERAETLSNNIRLNVTIVVLAGPDVAAAGLDGVSDHIVDETVLVPETSSLELSLVSALVDLLEDILEATIVLLQNRVLGRQVAREVPGEGVLHAGVGEAIDGLVSVVHAEHDTSALEVVDLEFGGLGAVLRGEGHHELAWNLGAEIGGSVLITESVSADNDGFFPAGHKFRDVADDDGLTEDGAADDVSDGTVGGLPHLLKVELGDTSLIRGDGCALNANLAGLDCFSGVDSDLIISGVTVLDAEIEVLDVKVQVRVNQLVLDELPDDSGHLVTVELSNGLGNLNSIGSSFGHLKFVVSCLK